ncbi:MAG: methyltransferase domain-containing protein [Synergistaceae bacterium]|jgi:cyclopropane fatty-acyl-phospholipid synthase-like methyltransferase|nr:methyltransferase domain-containing protein [Synergistaceae bacterium]
MKFGKHTEFTEEFYRKNLMGPSCVRLLEELSQRLTLSPDMRILDLGCGTGLTSIFLARESGAQIFATDLWLNATENYERFRTFGLDGQIIPIHADASELPFARGYFDLIVSIDAYYYFGTGKDFLDAHIAPLLKEDGVLAVSTPGLLREFAGNVPDVLKPWWIEEVNDTFHDSEWWKSLWGQSEKTTFEGCFQHKCHKIAWEDWLECDNPYAREDIKMMAAENGQYFTTIGLIARRVADPCPQETVHWTVAVQNVAQTHPRTE